METIWDLYLQRCRDTVNTEAKSGWQKRKTKNTHCIVFNWRRELTGKGTNCPYLNNVRRTYYKFVEVLGLSIQQRFHSYNSKVFSISFDGLNIQVIIWVTANDAIC